ncbi:MAG: hypothetical protein ACI8UO_003187 [Verrucomicrobiales bacterium]|jgi:hypothetical protein
MILLEKPTNRTGFPRARPEMISSPQGRPQPLEDQVLKIVHQFGPISASAIGALSPSGAPDANQLSAVLEKLAFQRKIAIMSPGGKPAYVDPKQLPGTN